MSTKIFNGYRLPASANLPAMARDINSRANIAVRVPALRAVAAVAMCLIADPPPDGRSSLEDTLWWLTNDQVKPEHIRRTARGRGTVLMQAAEIVDLTQKALRQPIARRVPLLDLTFSYTVMDDPADPGWLYATLYTEQPVFEQVWLETPGVEAFPYWNNSDRPDELTEAAWDERRDIWERVLPGWTPPARIGLCWNFVLEQPLATECLSHDEAAWLTPDAVLAAASSVDDPEAFARNRAAIAEKLVGPAARSV